jgi:hypothetical protein
MSRSDGLWIFIGVTLLRVNVLLVDLLLTKVNLPTVTEFARRNPWFAYVSLCIEAIGLFGLAVHLQPRE